MHFSCLGRGTCVIWRHGQTNVPKVLLCRLLASFLWARFSRGVKSRRLRHKISYLICPYVFDPYRGLLWLRGSSTKPRRDGWLPTQRRTRQHMFLHKVFQKLIRKMKNSHEGAFTPSRWVLFPNALHVLLRFRQLNDGLGWSKFELQYMMVRKAQGATSRLPKRGLRRRHPSNKNTSSFAKFLVCFQFSFLLNHEKSRILVYFSDDPMGSLDGLLYLNIFSDPTDLCHSQRPWNHWVFLILADLKEVKRPGKCLSDLAPTDV